MEANDSLKKVDKVNYEEMDEAVKNFVLANDLGYKKTYAIRYDDKNYEVGDIVACSKSNTNRDDSRNFPKFGSEEYNEASELKGTCCYNLNDREDYMNWDLEDFFAECGLSGEGVVQKSSSGFAHCSLVFGDKTNEFCEDKGEVVLSNCTVALKLW